ncbi:uncharacterized protein LOC144867108 [Branchiostoma floridae x Branchiostoma japonicum]
MDGRSNSTDDEALPDGLRTLNLNTQQLGDPDMGASGDRESTEVPGFCSLPVMKQELEKASKEPEKKKSVVGFFRSLSLRGTSSTKEKTKVPEGEAHDGKTKSKIQKRPSLGHRLRRSLSRRKRPVVEMECT